jgi:hypothetical protein
MITSWNIHLLRPVFRGGSVAQVGICPGSKYISKINFKYDVTNEKKEI